MWTISNQKIVGWVKLEIYRKYEKTIKHYGVNIIIKLIKNYTSISVAF